MIILLGLLSDPGTERIPVRSEVAGVWALPPGGNVDLDGREVAEQG